MSGRSGGFFGALRRMVSSTSELEAEELRRDAELEGVDTIAGSTVRQRVVLRGTIRTVTPPEEADYPRLEAEFEDGSGTLTLVWMGRREVPGIRAGTVLRMTGRLSSHRGQPALYNPRYELVRVPGIS